MDKIDISDTVDMLQPSINVGTIGNVSNGKSKIVEGCSGTATQKYKKEKDTNITIRLGYANSKIFKCDECDIPQCYQFRTSATMKSKCDHCKSPLTLVRHISFVDCPGHHTLMETMMSGASLMDCALLITSAANSIPGNQTAEHLAASQIMGFSQYLVILNKLDLISQEQVAEKKAEIEAFVKGTQAEGSPIIPMAANFGYNIDYLAYYLATHIKQPIRDLTLNPEMLIVRSFNTNKAGIAIKDLKGGVLGGSIIQGRFRLDDVIEIRPGIQMLDATRKGKIVYQPITATIKSLQSDKNNLTSAVAGGLIAIGTDIDPGIAKGDALMGNTVGFPGSMPAVAESMILKYNISETCYDDSSLEVGELHIKDQLKFAIKGSTILGLVTKKEDETIQVFLQKLVCVKKGDKFPVSKNMVSGWRLIGMAELIDYEEAHKYKPAT